MWIKFSGRQKSTQLFFSVGRKFWRGKKNKIKRKKTENQKKKEKEKTSPDNVNGREMHAKNILTNKPEHDQQNLGYQNWQKKCQGESEKKTEKKKEKKGKSESDVTNFMVVE